MNTPQDRYVFILVHSDLWGAMNANKLVKAIAEYHGKEGPLKPVLIVSDSTKNKEGHIAVGKNPSLSPVREIKEERLHTFFDKIDAMKIPQDCVIDEPPYLTFNALAKQYCADGVVHTIDSGGDKGAIKMQQIFDDLEKKGITPKLVLSGDTLAFVPKEVIKRYPCFGTHPGPLPAVPGMHATIRSVLYRQFFHADRIGRPDGQPYYRFSGRKHESYDEPMYEGVPHVAGTLFNLKEKLDEGPPIDFVYTPYVPGMSFIMLRHDLYDRLTDKMIERLPVLLDDGKREALLARKSNEHEERRKRLPITIPPLEENDLRKLIPSADPETREQYLKELKTSNEYALAVPHEEESHSLEVFRPSFFDPSWYRNALELFWPRYKASPELEEKYVLLRQGPIDHAAHDAGFDLGIRAGNASRLRSEAAREFDRTYNELFPDIAKFVNNTIETYDMHRPDTDPEIRPVSALRYQGR